MKYGTRWNVVRRALNDSNPQMHCEWNSARNFSNFEFVSFCSLCSSIMIIEEVYKEQL